MRIGIIGAGNIAARWHLPALFALPGVEVAALSSRRAEKARHMALRFGMPAWYDDHAALLARPDLDAVVIASPHPTHAAIALQALAAGKHVLLQKPIATRTVDAQRLLAAARASDRLLFPLPWFEEPALAALAARLAAGAVGEVSGARARFGHDGVEDYWEARHAMHGAPRGDNWYLDPAASGGGVLLDLGVYAVHVLVRLFGPVRRVAAMLAGAPVEQVAHLLLEMESGLLCSAEASWRQSRSATDRLAVYGTGGVLYLDARWRLNGEEVAGERPDPHARFLDFVRAGHRPLAELERECHVVAVLAAAYRSAQSGTAQAVV